MLTGGPKLVACEEDNDFTSAFGQMMSENLQVSMSEKSLSCLFVLIVQVLYPVDVDTVVFVCVSLGHIHACPYTFHQSPPWI